MLSFSRCTRLRYNEMVFGDVLLCDYQCDNLCHFVCWQSAKELVCLVCNYTGWWWFNKVAYWPQLMNLNFIWIWKKMLGWRQWFKSIDLVLDDDFDLIPMMVMFFYDRVDPECWWISLTFMAGEFTPSQGHANTFWHRPPPARKAKNRTMGMKIDE